VLEEGELLAMFFLGKHSSAVWMAERRGMEIVRLPGRAAIEK
jgi:hypothetical protein